jgi:hypothetical protein
MVFKPVDHFDAEVHAAIGGEISKARNALQAPRTVPTFGGLE